MSAPAGDAARMVEILKSRDLEIAEFHAMQLPLADCIERFQQELVAYRVGHEQWRRRALAAEANAAELADAMREVLRISDRRHDAWDRAKSALAKIDVAK
jgi:hypothetical protein